MDLKTLNGGMLLLARKRRRKTQTDLAKETGIAQAAISRVENGAREALSEEEVSIIANTLQFPVKFFYERDSYYRKPISVHGAAFRKKASVSVRDQEAIVSMANQYVIHVQKLLEAIDLEPQFPLLQFEVIGEQGFGAEHAQAVDSASEAARRVRASWGLGDGPLLSLVKYVEATGVFVLFGDFGGADIDGVTLRPEGMRPIIVINSSRPADRQRLSLAHEYGHVVLHAFPYDAMEKEAYEFAAELLMPATAIAKDFRQKLSLPRLGQLKLKWRVAMSALIYRAKSLAAISDYQATALYKKMSMYGYRVVEPVEFDIPRETPSLATQLIDLHMTSLGYTSAELADAALTNEQEFLLMHGMASEKPEGQHDRPKLRVIAGGLDEAQSA